MDMCLRGTNELIVDTTHGMLQNHSQVGYFVTSHVSGANCILGTFVCNRCRHDDFVWILQSFAKIFSRSPSVILTDQDVAFPKAIKQIFSDSDHHYCVWHKMLNFVGNLRNLFSTKDAEEWNIIMKLWWKLALSENEQLGEEWAESVWKHIVETVTTKIENLKDDDKRKDKSLYLSTQWDQRSQWIGCLLRGKFCPSRATSRSESTNALFKSLSRKTLTSVELIKLVKSVCDETYNKHDADFKELEKKFSYVECHSHCPLISYHKSLKHLTLHTQTQQTLKY